MSGIYRIDHKCTLCNSEQLTNVQFRHLKEKLMLFSSGELHDEYHSYKVLIIHILCLFSGEYMGSWRITANLFQSFHSKYF